MRTPIFIILVWLSAQPLFGQGVILWDESVNGPLGNSPGTATSLGIMTTGTNVVMGTAVVEPTGGSWYVHEDYFRFSIPANFQLSDILLTINGQSVAVFLGTSDFNTLVGYTPSSLSGALYPQFGIQPIGSGTYGMYMANHDGQQFTSIANYRLDFVVAPVPEPTTWALFALGGAAFACFRWRRPT